MTTVTCYVQWSYAILNNNYLKLRAVVKINTVHFILDKIIHDDITLTEDECFQVSLINAFTTYFNASMLDNNITY